MENHYMDDLVKKALQDMEVPYDYCFAGPAVDFSPLFRESTFRVRRSSPAALKRASALANSLNSSRQGVHQVAQRVSKVGLPVASFFALPSSAVYATRGMAGRSMSRVRIRPLTF